MDSDESFAKIRNVQTAHSLDISPTKMASDSILDQCAVSMIWSSSSILKQYCTSGHYRTVHFKAAEEAIFVYTAQWRHYYNECLNK